MLTSGSQTSRRVISTNRARRIRFRFSQKKKNARNGHDSITPRLLSALCVQSVEKIHQRETSLQMLRPAESFHLSPSIKALKHLVKSTTRWALYHWQLPIGSRRCLLITYSCRSVRKRQPRTSEKKEANNLSIGVTEIWKWNTKINIMATKWMKYKPRPVFASPPKKKNGAA